MAAGTDREDVVNGPPHSVTFNIPCDLWPAVWAALVGVYEAMPGQVDGASADGCPLWRPDGPSAGVIRASAEPSCLLITGDVCGSTWRRWIAEFERRATAALGFRVHDAEE